MKNDEPKSKATNLEKATIQYLKVAEKLSQWYNIEIEVHLLNIDGIPKWDINVIGEYPMETIQEFFEKIEGYKVKLYERWGVKL